MTVRAAQEPALEQPVTARMVRWPHPLLVMVIMLWVVPGAVFFSGSPIGTALLSAALLNSTFSVWLYLPVPMLIGGLVWIIRVRRTASTRWQWISAWTVIVAMAVPPPDFVLQIIGPIGRDVTFAGIAGSIAASTGDMMAQSIAFLIFGTVTIALLTCAARSAYRRPFAGGGLG